jgi:hypothetical protein
MLSDGFNQLLFLLAVGRNPQGGGGFVPVLS